MQRLHHLQDGTVDLLSGMVRRGDDEVQLSGMQLQLLAYLAARPGEVVAREELLTRVWGYAEGVSSRTVDITVARLRKRIEADPSSPRHLLTVIGEGYRFVPPRRSEPPTNLPTPDAPLVGREPLLGTLDELAGQGVRWVTLHGPGGVGKTALARAWAAQRRTAHPAGVWFCPLAGCRDVDEVESAVAQVLGASDVVQELATDEPLLLVLDEAEEVVQALQRRLPEWLGDAPTARVLVTSRVPVSLPTEHRLAVPPLQAEDARRLLLARGTAVRGGWTPTDDDRQVLADIARALDGLPLALELAGARLKMLSPRQLQGHLDERFALLRRGDTALEATLDWAWQRLDPTQRELLAWALVFRGGFSAEAADGVLDAGLDALEALVDTSLLQVAGGHPVRFHLLENVRVFVRDRVGDPPWPVVQAHATWYLARARDLAEDPRGPAWMRRERANLLAAHEQVLERDPVLAGRLLVTGSSLLGMGSPQHSRALLDATLEALGDAGPVLRARLHELRADTWVNLDRRSRAREDVRDGLALAEQAGERDLQARLLVRAVAYGDLLDEPVEATRARALRLARETNAPRPQWRLLMMRALERHREGRIEASATLLREAADVVEGRPDLQGHRAWALTQHALACTDLGRHGEARRALRHAEAGFVARGSAGGLAIVAYGRGRLALDRDDHDEALCLLAASQRDLPGTHYHKAVCYAECHLAALHLLRGERQAALRRALDAVERLRDSPPAATAHALAAAAAEADPERAHHTARAREKSASWPVERAVVTALLGQVEAQWAQRSVLVRVAERLPRACRIE